MSNTRSAGHNLLSFEDYERDALIAATALVRGMAVVTRNVADFKPTEVIIVNSWSPLP